MSLEFIYEEPAYFMFNSFNLFPSQRKTLTYSLINEFDLNFWFSLPADIILKGFMRLEHIVYFKTNSLSFCT